MDETRIGRIFADAVSRGASDVHLAAGQRPFLRLDGELAPLSEEALTQAETEAFLA